MREEPSHASSPNSHSLEWTQPVDHNTPRNVATRAVDQRRVLVREFAVRMGMRLCMGSANRQLVDDRRALAARALLGPSVSTIQVDLASVAAGHR